MDSPLSVVFGFVQLPSSSRLWTSQDPKPVLPSLTHLPLFSAPAGLCEASSQVRIAILTDLGTRGCGRERLRQSCQSRAREESAEKSKNDETSLKIVILRQVSTSAFPDGMP